MAPGTEGPEAEAGTQPLQAVLNGLGIVVALLGQECPAGLGAVPPDGGEVYLPVPVLYFRLRGGKDLLELLLHTAHMVHQGIPEGLPGIETHGIGQPNLGPGLLGQHMGLLVGPGLQAVFGAA